MSKTPQRRGQTAAVVFLRWQTMTNRGALMKWQLESVTETKTNTLALEKSDSKQRWVGVDASRKEDIETSLTLWLWCHQLHVHLNILNRNISWEHSRGYTRRGQITVVLNDELINETVGWQRINQQLLPVEKIMKVPASKISCFSLFHVSENWISFGLGLLVEQNKQLQDVTIVSGNLQWAFCIRFWHCMD